MGVVLRNSDFVQHANIHLTHTITEVHNPDYANFNGTVQWQYTTETPVSTDIPVGSWLTNLSFLGTALLGIRNTFKRWY